MSHTGCQMPGLSAVTSVGLLITNKPTPSFMLISFTVLSGAMLLSAEPSLHSTIKSVVCGFGEVGVKLTDVQPLIFVVSVHFKPWEWTRADAAPQ